MSCYRYRNLIERVLRARLVYGSPNMNRSVSFEYMNRQLVWNEFSVNFCSAFLFLRSFIWWLIFRWKLLFVGLGSNIARNGHLTVQYYCDVYDQGKHSFHCFTGILLWTKCILLLAQGAILRCHIGNSLCSCYIWIYYKTCYSWVNAEFEDVT